MIYAGLTLQYSVIQSETHVSGCVCVCVVGVRVLFQVAVVLVRRCLGDARHRKECEGQMETLERLRSVKGHVQHDQADAFIQEVSNLDWCKCSN